MMLLSAYFFLFFFFNDTATTEIYTLSLHDALPISYSGLRACSGGTACKTGLYTIRNAGQGRSEEHTSELQSRRDLVCRLLLEKKKKKKRNNHHQKQNHNPNANLTTTRRAVHSNHAK